MTQTAVLSGWLSGCLWNSGTVADLPTCHSKRSVPALLPAVAEMLETLHKVRRGLTSLKVTATTTNKSKHLFCYWLGPGTFWCSLILFMCRAVMV
jgi:hypothetical protein